MFFRDSSHSLKIFWYIPARKVKQKFSIVISQVDKVCLFLLFMVNFQAYLFPLIQEPPQHRA